MSFGIGIRNVVSPSGTEKFRIAAARRLHTFNKSLNVGAVCVCVLLMQVPYLEDPNTGVKMFESADIVEYLQQTYAIADSPKAA